MSDRIITRDELNSHLWGAADILRGTADASEFKNHIFGLLFLKRLSDVFEERRQEIIEHYVKKKMSQAKAEEIADSDPDEYGDGSFFLPEHARWSYLMKVGENRAEALDVACREIEEQNSRYLEGVLGDISYNTNRLAGDPKELDGLMQRLLTHFDRLPLGNRNLSEPDVLGNAYEYLIERFAEAAGKKGGEFFTPRGVVRLIVELLAPKEGMRICDPTVGSGGMLIECAHYVEAHGGNPKNLSLFGQEKNVGTWSIAKMNMLLHNIPDADLKKGDTIRNPKLVEHGRLMTFDRVIANPPFSLKDWGHEAVQKDAFKRFTRGIPPRTKGDLAFLQHMVETATDEGMVGVVMPHGVLFRGSSEGTIRQKLLEEDLFEAVIGLPANLFFGTGIPAAILILNKAKPKARRNQVLFIDASGEGFYREGSNQNYLRDEDILRVAAVYEAYAEPGEVAGATEKIAGAWIKNAKSHKRRQLERAGRDAAVKTRIESEAAKRMAELESATAAVKKWLGNDGSLDRFARVVPLEEIKSEHDFNLNISRYVDTTEPEPPMDVEAELVKLKELMKDRDAAEKKMFAMIKELGYGG